MAALSCQTECADGAVLLGLSVMETKTIKMLHFYLPACCWLMSQLRLRPGSGFLQEVLEIQCFFTVNINFPAESLQSLQSLISTVMALLPAKTKRHCMLPCGCLCLCSGTVAAAGMEEKGRMSQPISRTWLHFNEGLPGWALLWHTESFCNLRSPDPWLSRASWHLQTEVDLLKSDCKRLSSNWLHCLAGI